MNFTAIIVVCALFSLLFLIFSARRFQRRRVAGGMFHGAAGLIFALVCVSLVLLGANLRTYQRLTHEQLAGELQLARTGDKQFTAVLTYPDGQKADFALRGDEWQVDARFLKWHALANLLGFDAAYRLERIGGRYTSVDEERAQPRTVYPLAAPPGVDPWDLVQRYRGWIPWVDALYGSATYLPMADGALYEIKVSQSGLVSRPLNQAARDAAGGWH
jgi:hypothetical protein